MSKQIGFTPPAPRQEVWQKTFGPLTVIYTKEKKSNGVFMYDCECRKGTSSSATGFHSDRPELSRDEVENWPRFVELVNGWKPR